MDSVAGLVSVMMPALNEEASIADAIASVLSQRDVEVEILVMDGGSVDKTRLIASRIATSDPRVRVLDNPNTTIPHGLNVGLEHARGEFLARVDCHATVSQHYLASALAHLSNDPRLAGVGGIRKGVSDTARGRAVALALSSRFGVGNSVNHYGDHYQLTDHASLGVYRTQVARAVGGWDEMLAVNEDVDFDHRILQAGHCLAYDPDMIIHWQVRKSAQALFRQYRRYGRGKAAMVRKNGPGAVRARHLAAPAAVSGSAVLLLASVWFPMALLGIAPYALAVAVASATAWRRRSRVDATSARTIPLAFLAMHAGWGLGFLEGVVMGLRPARASGSSETAVRSTVGKVA